MKTIRHNTCFCVECVVSSTIDSHIILITFNSPQHSQRTVVVKSDLDVLYLHKGAFWLGQWGKGRGKQD